VRQVTVEREELTAGRGEGLISGVEIAPPAELAVGRGSAFAIGGYCYHPHRETSELWIELGGERQPIAHAGLPRLDGYVRGGERGFRSGFLARVRLAPRSVPEEPELRLVARLAGGGEASASLGTLRLLPEPAPPRDPAPSFPDRSGARVAICMASYDPPPELLASQLDSIRAQTHSNWICLISDDGSRPELLRALRAHTDGDPRFVVSPAPERRGFYANFERALSMVPAETDFVALCDQDDRWHPGKLERLLERMEDGVELAYSDARVVDSAGGVVHPSYWTARRNNHANLASLLIANTVTGAASLFRRRLLDDVLPFPPRLASPFHDHWLALVALARGRIAYLERPLYDYVQHPGAVIGHATANRPPVPVRERLRERLRNPGKGSQIVFFYNWTQQQLFAEILRMRCGDRMEERKRRAVERFISVDRSLAGLGWLLGRRLRRLAGRNETMDIERFYAKALLRMRLVALQARGSSPPRWLRRDASIPPAPASEAAP
jgi:glycosyltransferase involved in cell wall biosynthesis